MTTAKVFMSGSSQAVRLPKEFRFDVSEVVISKIGYGILLTPKDKVWDNFIEGEIPDDDYFDAVLKRPGNGSSQERETL